MVKLNFSKSSKYDSKPIIIDGFSGSGKILISELLKAYSNAEISTWNLSFDYLPILYSFKTIEKEAAKSTLRTLFDEITYNISIGRNLNWRRKDLSFAFDHPKKLSYLQNMFLDVRNDNFIIEKVAPKMNIPFLVHMATFNNYLLEDTFGEGLKIFYSLRDPLFILETYSSYLYRIASDPREFTPKFNFNGLDLPWFANGWEEEYSKINQTEKSITLIEKCFDHLYKKLSSTQNNKKYKVIFFEDIISRTDDKCKEIAEFLNLDYKNSLLSKIKKKNKLPRNNNNVVEGFWKRYTTNNISRDGENEENILYRTRGLTNKYYFEKLQTLRIKYFKFKQKINI